MGEPFRLFVFTTTLWALRKNDTLGVLHGIYYDILLYINYTVCCTCALEVTHVMEKSVIEQT